MKTRTRHIGIGLAVLTALASTGCDRIKGGKSDGGELTLEGGAGATSAAKPGEASGVVTTIAPATEGVWGVGMDANNVYYSTMNTPQGLRRKARSAPADAPSELLCKIADTALSPQSVFVDATHVYVIANALGPGAVYRAPKGAKGVDCEKVASGLGFVTRGITRLGDTVYAVGSSKTGSSIVAIDAAGKSRPVAQLPKPAEGLTTDGTNLFFGSKESMTDMRLMRIAPSGGAATEIGKAGLGLRYAEGRLFYIGASMASVPVTGGAPAMIGKTTPIVDFAVVGARLYYAGFSGIDSGYLSRTATSGGDVTQHASFQGTPIMIAADERDIYISTMKKTLLRVSP